MLKTIKKHYVKIIIIACDLLVLPLIMLCRSLSSKLLDVAATQCVWELLGAKCITCGGTHFVRDICSGRFIDAFFDNQYLFILAVYFLITLIALNLCFVFGVKWAKKLLIKMYSITALIIAGVGMVAFVVLRNIPFWIALARLIADKLL